MRKFFYLLAALVAFPVHAQTGFRQLADRVSSGGRGTRHFPRHARRRADRHHAGRDAWSSSTGASPNSCRPLPIIWTSASRRPGLRADRPCCRSMPRCWMRWSRNTAFRKTVLVSFWGLETNYGATLGSHNIPASLATLAFDGRRSAFFRSQLLDALRIIDAGHVQAIDMNGSWAGAMGHMQFMPSTFRAYAVDGDGDGRIDLWQSRARRHALGRQLSEARGLARKRAGGAGSASAGQFRLALCPSINNRLAGVGMDGARRAEDRMARPCRRWRAAPPSSCRRAGKVRPSWCSTTSTWSCSGTAR